MEKNKLDGQQFGRLTVITRVDHHKPVPYYLCKCSCGNEKITTKGSLVECQVLSCGCQRREKTVARNYRHGLSRTPEHRIWIRMRDRCNNPNNKDYADYGGRGIRVCSQWDDFLAFLSHVGSRPSPKHSIDRIDNSLGYQPGNVQWVLFKDQANNKRNNVFIEYKGERKTVGQWASDVGLRHNVLYKRLFVHHWTVERALETPLRS